KVIADISCDIGGPNASTLRSSTIADPFYGYDPAKEIETRTGAPGSITVMAVDNLPAELPRDASATFGLDLLEKVMPHLVEDDAEGMIEKATIASNGELSPHFAYLK